MRTFTPTLKVTEVIHTCLIDANASLIDDTEKPTATTKPPRYAVIHEGLLRSSHSVSYQLARGY